MVRLFKLLLFLIVIGAIGVVAYGYLGADVEHPQQEERSVPVDLDAS